MTSYFPEDKMQISHPSEVFPVKFPGICEDDSPCGHVESHGECLGGKQRFDQTLAEKDLNRFLQDGKQSGVVNSDASL